MKTNGPLGNCPSHHNNFDLLFTVTETTPAVSVCLQWDTKYMNLLVPSAAIKTSSKCFFSIVFSCPDKFYFIHGYVPSSLSNSPSSLPHSSSSSSRPQRWCTPWSSVTWRPSSRGCTRAGLSITPEPKTSRTLYASIICRRASSSECWSIFRQRGRSTTASTVMRYNKKKKIAQSKCFCASTHHKHIQKSETTWGKWPLLY